MFQCYVGKGYGEIETCSPYQKFCKVYYSFYSLKKYRHSLKIQMFFKITHIKSFLNTESITEKSCEYCCIPSKLNDLKSLSIKEISCCENSLCNMSVKLKNLYEYLSLFIFFLFNLFDKF